MHNLKSSLATVFDRLGLSRRKPLVQAKGRSLQMEAIEQRMLLSITPIEIDDIDEVQ